MTDDEKILEWLGYKPCTCGQECGGMYLHGLYYQPLPIDYNLMFTVVLPALRKQAMLIAVHDVGDEYIVRGFSKQGKIRVINSDLLDALKSAVVKMIKEKS